MNKKVETMRDRDLAARGQERFGFAELAWREKGRTFHRNLVVRSELVGKMAAGLQVCGNEVFTSVYRFEKALAAHSWGNGTVGGYTGPCVGPLVWDFDWPKEPEVAWGAAVEFSRLLKHEMGVAEEAFGLFYSGLKGGHVVVDEKVMGAQASLALPAIYKALRHELLRKAAISPEFADQGFGGKLQLLRKANSRNGGTGLYKIQVTLAEAKLGFRNVRKLAREPRPLVGTEDGLRFPAAKPVAKLVEAFRDAAERVMATGALPREATRPAATIGDVARQMTCAARLELWKVRPGERNAAAIRLTSYYRAQGLGRETVAAVMIGWNAGLAEPLEERELEAIIRHAFAPAGPYRYRCCDALIAEHCAFKHRTGDCAWVQSWRMLAR